MEVDVLVEVLNLSLPNDSNATSGKRIDQFNACSV